MSNIHVVAERAYFSPANFGEIQKTKNIQAMIDADEDNVVFPSEICAVVYRESRRSDGVCAAMQPNHNGALVLRRCSTKH